MDILNGINNDRFTLHIKNREYTEWEWLPSNAKCDINPLEAKLFHGDSIDINTRKTISSPLSEHMNICGILILNDGKTYGRHSSKTNKLLYKCIPDDNHLPCFLVPYEEKVNTFIKSKKNKYVTFSIREWKDKHPLGIIENVYGNTDNTEAYITYQMQLKCLNDKMNVLNAVVLRVLRETHLGPLPLYCNNKKIEDRQDRHIFSIDPVGCNDIDDAIGIVNNVDGDRTRVVLSIYISNVPMILEYLNIWEYLTDRVSSIYLFNKKYTMLPLGLCEYLCSLKENETKVAYVLDVYIENNRIIDIKHKPVIIKVTKNYAYNDYELNMNTDYKLIFDIIKNLNNEEQIGFKYVDDILNSHDIIEYCMILMNHQCGQLLKNKKKGIYRSANKKSIESNREDIYIYENLSPTFQRVLQNVVGEYCSYENHKPHELIGGGISYYAQMTSPIRRIVDCVNLLELQKDQFEWSSNSNDFLVKWLKSIEFINKQTKSIRKLQNEVELLTQYEKNNKQIYTGSVFSRESIVKNENIVFKYRVFIPSIKLLTTMKSDKYIEDYSTVDFSIHLFLDESKMSQKARLQIA